MNKQILLSLFFVFSFLTLVQFISADVTNTCNLNISLINQDPNPVTPGEYVNVLLQVSGTQNPNCIGAKVELVPTYPFSFDANESGVKILDSSTYTQNSNSAWMISYRLRVDKDALDGNSQIEIHYNSNYRVGVGDGSYVVQKFDVAVQDSRTSFDAVIQDVSSSAVSIAIANTGKYAANSVIVKIPDQDYFTTTTTNGQMVGTLDISDYTVVSFSISSKKTFTKDSAKGNPGVDPNSIPENLPETGMQTSKNLKFDIYYTDNLGERRVVNLELPLTLSSTSTTLGTNMGFKKRSSWSIWYTILIILGVLGIALFIFYKKFPKQTKELFGKLKNKINKLFKSKKGEQHSGEPEWIKNFKEKEK